MIGILTEKPSARRNFEKALGGTKGKYNGEEYIIVNALGHLYQLREPKEQVDKGLSDKYSSWHLDNLPWDHKDFEWKYKMSRGGQKHLREIKDKLSKCDEIVIATDIDPTGEGDLLAWEILIGQKLTNKKLSRMEFVDETEKTIQNSFVNRRPVESADKEYDYQKALFRSKWDFLSMQFTRIATNLSPVRAVIPQGRLKSTMVYLVGEAQKKLDNHVEVPYFENKFKDENGVIYTDPKAERFDNAESVPNTFKDSEVILDKTELKKTAPPRMIDLAILASRLSSRGFSSEEVLATYQKMYQDGILSYPRTDDKKITDGQFIDLFPLASEIAKVVKVDHDKLTHTRPRKTHVSNKSTHGANRPGLKVPKSLKSLDRYGRSASAIYSLLAKNYLATLAEDYEYERQSGHIKDYPNYKGSANIPKSLGWKEIYDAGEPEEESLSSGLGKLGKPFVHKGYPPAPPTPTMGWLMKQLDRNNVGSGATRTSTLTDVTSTRAKYPLMTNERGRLKMTAYGKISHQMLEGTKIGDVKTTETILDAMDRIGEGNIGLADKYLEATAKLVEHDMKIMRENSKNIEIPEGVKSDKSGEFKNVEKEKAKIKGKEISFKKEWGGHKFTEAEIEKLSNGETITIKNLKNKRGKSYSAKGKLMEQKFKKNKFWGFKMVEYHEEGKSPVAFDN